MMTIFKQEQKQTQKDMAIWIIATILLLAGFIANYYFIYIPLPLRLVGWLLLVIVLIGLISLTALGKRGWKFFKDSKSEMRKVVWPTRHETIQTTLMVIIMVIVLAVFLWGVDSVFMWLITRLTS